MAFSYDSAVSTEHDGDPAKPPVLRLILPVGREERWSDLLAVMVESDPGPMCWLLGIKREDNLDVVREAVVDTGSRPDLVLRVGGRSLAVIENKLLSGFGRRQLDRYVRADPDADCYVVIHPERLALTVDDPWRAISWEDVLAAYSESTSRWVATTAAAWREHLDTALPVVGPDTVWNRLVPGEEFSLALRARMSWVYNAIEPPDGVDCDLVSSAAGQSWVARVMRPASVPGYRVQAEIEERLAARGFPKFATDSGPLPLGPKVTVALLQSDVDTSSGFDWDYLLAIWTEVMSTFRADWSTTPARPKAEHDRVAHQRMVELGGSPHLGAGFGDRQTRINRECMFGARIQLPAHITLRHLAEEMNDLARLVHLMAQVRRPP